MLSWVGKLSSVPRSSICAIKRANHFLVTSSLFSLRRVHVLLNSGRRKRTNPCIRRRVPHYYPYCYPPVWPQSCIPCTQSRIHSPVSYTHLEPTRRTPISYAVFCLKKK